MGRFNKTADQRKIRPGARIKPRKPIKMQLEERLRFERLLKENVGMWSWDYKTNIIWGSEEARAMYGFSSDEEISGEKFFNRLHPDDLQRLTRIVEEAFRSGSVVQTDYRIVLPDKSIRWILVRAQTYLKPSGEPDRMLGVSFDVTQRKQSEMEMARLRFELWHLSRAIAMNELSSSLAHEINQPLGAILNNASAAKLLMPQAENKRGEIDDILEDIIRDSKRAGNIIRKIRGLVKRTNVQFEPVVLNALIEDVVSLFQSSLSMNKVLLLLELSSDLPEVRGDYVHLQQVLLNLMTNALEVMKESPDKKLLIRSAMKDADTAVVSVSDSGAGISDAGINKVFDPFFTTKKDGLGMGLAICRSIIEEHGGRIWAENNPTGGATFLFSLKVWKGESA